uniref:PB1 domain-containing protein n=1 Tax=Oryza glumipatula TaxID=40148 RepID=A0A0D9ZIE5_9ORYZ
MAPAGYYGASVSMMISYGGAIVQADGKAKAAYYAGGVHRIVKVGMSERLPGLRARLAALAGCADVFIRYALPGEGLGVLRDVADDGDLWSLVSLLFYYKEVAVSSKPGRIRVFLFAADHNAPPHRTASAPSLPALAASGGASAAATPVTLGLPRSASSPSLATSGSGTAVRMKVSYGGEIIQQQRGGSAAASCYYAGGVHRIVRVGLSERLAGLRARLAALAGFSDSDNVRIRYALPGEEGLHLHDVASDGDLWSLVSLLFFHEAVMATPKQGRIRVFLFAADDAPATSSTSPTAAPLRRSASSPFLPTLVEEDEDDDDNDGNTDTAAATQTSTSRVTATVGMRRSASSPALATTSSSSDAATASTSGSATSGSSGDSDTPAMTSSSTAAVQLGPVVLVPVMVVFPVIPVYAIGVVDYRGVLLVA